VTRAGSAATLTEIKKRGYMTVATEDDYQPFEFTQNGKPTGYDQELLELFKKKAGFEIRQDIIPWTGILPGVTTGKYDAAVTAILVTQERMKTVDFCSPVVESVNYYLKRKGDKRIQGIKDLSGLSLGVEAGSAMLKLRRSSMKCSRRPAASSARSSPTKATPKPIKTWRWGASTLSSTRD
jgi:polar amino acid transport system substrate-binding protein